MTPQTSSATRKNKIVAIILLLLTAIIWGMCFVAQRSGMEFIGPFLFNGLRQLLGVLTLVAVLASLSLFERLRIRQGAADNTDNQRESTLSVDVASKESSSAILDEASSHSRKDENSSKRSMHNRLIRSGIICGSVLFIGGNLQQIGMVATTASKAGFITTLYIVLVPLLGIAFFKQRTRWSMWLSVLIAVVGLYLLCMSESFAIAPGDAVVLVSALFWALHILLIGHYAPHLGQREVLKLCIVQYLITGILSLICVPFLDGFFVTQPLSWDALLQSAPSIAYAGIMSTGIAFTIAAIGQRHAPPTPAAIIMSTESVFSLLGGVVLLNEIMSGREIIGCILMFIAVIVAQLKFEKKKKNDKLVPNTRE